MRIQAAISSSGSICSFCACRVAFQLLRLLLQSHAPPCFPRAILLCLGGCSGQEGVWWHHWQEDSAGGAFVLHFSSDAGVRLRVGRINVTLHLRLTNMQGILLQWRAWSIYTKRLQQTKKRLQNLLDKRSATTALSRMFRFSVATSSAASEERACAAAAAIKTHAAATVKAMMGQLESAHVELDEYRRDALAALALQAHQAHREHHRHNQKQQQQQQQQQLFISGNFASDSWSATADFVRSKLSQVGASVTRAPCSKMQRSYVCAESDRVLCRGLVVKESF